MIKTFNAFTKEEMATYPEEIEAMVAHKVLTARQISRRWRKAPIEERCQLISEKLEYFESNREAIAKDITLHIGRPIAQARREIDDLLERARYLISIAGSTLKPELIDGKEGFVRQITHEPHGIVFVISAWNYPLLVTINGVVAALLAGNGVLLKHSPLTPSIGLHFEKAFATIPSFEGLFQNSMMSHSTANAVLASGIIDHTVFTGSVDSGREVYTSAAKGLSECHLELGGKDAAYVADDADIEKAAADLVEGACDNAGQSCCGIERVFVHKKVYNAFINKCEDLMAEYIIGDPSNEETTLGPLARGEEAAAVLSEQIKTAVSQGAEVVCGGEVRKLEQALFFEPTLLTGVKPNMSVMREENFGPLLPVMKVGRFKEAINHINDSDYGLSAIIYTKDQKQADLFFDSVDVGTVFMNQCDHLDPALPWTGIKSSGLGSALSQYGLLEMTRRKAKHFKTN